MTERETSAPSFGGYSEPTLWTRLVTGSGKRPARMAGPSVRSLTCGTGNPSLDIQS